MPAWNCDHCQFLTSVDPCYRCGKKREASDNPKENLRRLMQGEATGVEEPEGGIAAYTDYDAMCRCGSLMHRAGECEAMERVIEAARVASRVWLVKSNLHPVERELLDAIAALDSVYSSNHKETK